MKPSLTIIFCSSPVFDIPQQQQLNVNKIWSHISDVKIPKWTIQKRHKNFMLVDSLEHWQSSCAKKGNFTTPLQPEKSQRVNNIYFVSSYYILGCKINKMLQYQALELRQRRETEGKQFHWILKEKNKKKRNNQDIWKIKEIVSKLESCDFIFTHKSTVEK